MRFKVDENLPPEVTSLLRDLGHDARTIWDEGLSGRPDAELAQACQAERRTLVTLDTGFGDIRTYPPEQFAGLIVLRLAKQNRSHVLAVFRRVMTLIPAEPLSGRLWVVEEDRVRVRAGREEQ
jgi:predicted nuclease of predicted toxin-antitoxin system